MTRELTDAGYLQTKAKLSDLIGADARVSDRTDLNQAAIRQRCFGLTIA